MFFFFNDTATSEIYTLSLHDALPICGDVDGDGAGVRVGRGRGATADAGLRHRLRVHFGQHRTEVLVGGVRLDRKSTRLNSSHANISYAVFCLKKKKKHAVCQRRREKS